MSAPVDLVHPRRRVLGVGAAIVAVIVVAAVTVFIGVLRSGTPIEVVTPAVQVTSAVEAAPIFVHVSGAVAEPGLYRLSGDARVVDAVGAAGGFADGADEAAVNLARVVADGEQLHVPVIGEVPAPAAAAPGSAGGVVNLNSADAAALETLPRIGPALAERIIAWRDQNGRFTSVEDLLAVPGIGEKVLEGLRDSVTV